MKLTPAPPIFPSVGEDGKIREAHLPDRLSKANLRALILDLIGDGGGGTGPDPVDGPEESPAGSGLYTATGLAENPADSGLFDIPTSLTPDPDNPGLYLIGA